MVIDVYKKNINDQILKDEKKTAEA